MAKKKGINVPLLRKVQKFLLAEPRRFDMSDWISTAEFADVIQPPPCGAACCIAGAAFIIDRKIRPADAPELTFGIGIGYEASHILNLDEGQRERLFFMDEWPDKFLDAYGGANTPLQRAKVGVARIEHFIKTDGAE